MKTAITAAAPWPALALAAAAGALAVPVDRDGRRRRHPGRRSDHRADQIPARISWSSRPRRRSPASTSSGRLSRRRQPVNPTEPERPGLRLEPARPDLTGLDAAGITPIVSTYSTPDLGGRGHEHHAHHRVQPQRAQPGGVRGVHAGGRDPLQRHLHPTGALAALPRVRHYEIWNEPNLKAFFSVNVQHRGRVHRPGQGGLPGDQGRQQERHRHRRRGRSAQLDGKARQRQGLDEQARRTPGA